MSDEEPNEFARAMLEHEKKMEADFNALPEDIRIAAAFTIMRHIVDHAKDGGSFRHLIYSRLGLGMGAYMPLCGVGQIISNEFSLEYSPDSQQGGETIASLGKMADQYPGGSEERILLLNAGYEIQGLRKALGDEMTKRNKVMAELKENLSGTGILPPAP